MDNNAHLGFFLPLPRHFFFIFFFFSFESYIFQVLWLLHGFSLADWLTSNSYKNRYLSSVFQYASFNTSHDYIWKENFLNFATEDSKLWSQNISEMYDSEKKFKLFLNPLAQGQCCQVLWTMLGPKDQQIRPNKNKFGPYLLRGLFAFFWPNKNIFCVRIIFSRPTLTPYNTSYVNHTTKLLMVFNQTLTQFDRYGQPKAEIMDIRTELW